MQENILKPLVLVFFYKMVDLRGLKKKVLYWSGEADFLSFFLLTAEGEESGFYTIFYNIVLNHNLDKHE
jgi:hypothetical protein